MGAWSLVGKAATRRYYASMTLHKGKVYIFGGAHDYTCYNDLHCFDLETHTAEELIERKKASHPDTGKHFPSPRSSHGAQCYNNQLIIFGGWQGQGFSND